MKKEKVVKNTDIESSLKADELSSDFASFYQGQITNSVTAISKKSKHEVDPETQAWLFPVEELGGGKVVLENADKNELTLSSAKLLAAPKSNTFIVPFFNNIMLSGLISL